MTFISEHFPVIISVIALAISIFTWYRGHRNSLYDHCDTALNDLVKLSLEYPQFRDEELCLKALNSDDDLERLRYDGFAVLVWNYLETLYDKYGNRLSKTPFHGAMLGLGQRHKHYLFKDDAYLSYNIKLLSYLKVNKQPK